MAQRRGQGAFEYILMLSGVLLVVITITYMMQGTVSSADNTLDAQMKSAGIALDPSFYTPGAKPQFLSSTPADGSGSTTRPNISAAITVRDAQLTELKYNWNGTNYTIYDQSLVLGLDFDDASLAGDSASRAVDASPYGNNGRIYGNTALLLHMDENASSRVCDESRFANNGTCYTNGAAAACNWTAGKSGSGIFLNGSSYIAVPDIAAYDPGAGDFAFEAWVSLYAYSFLNGIVSHGNAESTPGFYIRSDSSTSIQFVVNTGGSTFRNIGASGFPAGQWYHLVAMKAGNTLSVYRNGAQVASTNYGAQGWSASSADSMLIGYVHGRLFNGSIDEVAFYNRSLSASEVLAHYNAGRAKHADWALNGKWGGAMRFDGRSTYVEVPLSPSIGSVSNDFTISAWFNRAGPSGGTSDASYHGIMRGGTSWAPRILVTSDGSLVLLEEALNGSTSRLGLSASFPFNIGEWHHIVVRKGTYGTEIFVDGTRRASNAAMYGRTSPFSTQFYIGTGATPIIHYMANGTIDGVRIWNRSLSAEEINMQYRSNLYKYTPNAWFFEYRNESLAFGTYNYTLYTSGGYRKEGSSETRTVTYCQLPWPC